jgi:hypothetical protein
MIRVSLKLEEEVVGEPMRGIPTVLYCHLLILSIAFFFALQTIVLNVVDNLQIHDSTSNLEEVKDEALRSKFHIDKSAEKT